MDTAGNAPTPDTTENSIQFSGFANEPHQVIWFNDETGSELGSFDRSGTTFTLTLSGGFTKHTALVIRPN